MIKSVEIIPGFASSVRGRISRLESFSRQFGSELRFLSFWGGNPDRTMQQTQPGIVTFKNKFSQFGLELEYFNVGAEAKDELQPARFAFFEKGTGRTTKNRGNSSLDVKWRFLELFGEDEVKKWNFQFSEGYMPSPDNPDQLESVMCVTFDNSNDYCEVAPNEKVVGLAFRLNPSQPGTLEGDIYPMLKPVSVDYSLIDGYETRDGSRLKVG